ncbi:RNA-binding protein 47-like [Prorops nasuta]|uniref:RNA-binding protein 47-like n=1 Tax=Prorops nasuta TaxID=863751 RepID=UPI0034CFA6EF
MLSTKATSIAIDNTNLGDDCELTLRLLELLKQTDYELVQENGQRRLTAPEIASGEKHRIKGAEIFLGRLPRDCYEDELMPILQRIGRLMELRLMLDFSGSTRGYAFVLYADTKTAKKACQELDGYQIRPGHRIGVVKSVDNCRLFFGGVPKNKGKAEFLEELNKILEGITDIYLYPSAHDKSLNRGFIFVEFKDHRAAAMARRKLIPGRVMLWDHEIAVDWADPEPGDPIDEDVMQTVTALFVRNLSLNTSQQKMREIFQRDTGIPILKLKKINHFAFIHYENRESAHTVFQIMSRPGSVAEKEGWEIRWAKPIGATKLLERQKCINEAVAQSGKIEKKSERKLTKDASSLKNKILIDEGTISKSTAHMNALQTLVLERFNAFCTFECLRATDYQGFMCKVTIFKDGHQQFEYLGDVMPSKHKAISVTSLKLYHDLNQIREHPDIFQNCTTYSY